MNSLEAMARRVSTRTFPETAVPLEQLEAVRAAGDNALTLSPAQMRFLLVTDGARLGKELKGLLGDYGKVIRAPHYVVLVVRESEHYLLDAGYRFEQLVLEATARGLGTCWIGGFFKEATLGPHLGIAPDEKIVALSPLGSLAANKSLLERFMRTAVGSNDRKPLHSLFSWMKHGEPLPPIVVDDEHMARFLEAVRRAPSWANKQPWRFVLRPEELLLFKETKQLKEGKDYHLVDCGIVMAHVTLAARELGMAGEWRLDLREVPGASKDAEPIGRFVFQKPVVSPR